MRHGLSILLALVLTPLIYISAGTSAVKLGEANPLGSTAVAPVVIGLVAAFVAGGLLAVLLMARLSPLGPVLAGLLFLGTTLWALFDRDGLRDLLPADLFGIPNVLHVPVPNGTALLAMPLLFTVFSPRRWRRTGEPGPVSYDAAPNYPPAPDSAAPDYSGTAAASAAPAYEPYTPTVYTPPTSAPTIPSQSDKSE